MPKFSTIQILRRWRRLDRELRDRCLQIGRFVRDWNQALLHRAIRLEDGTYPERVTLSTDEIRKLKVSRKTILRDIEDLREFGQVILRCSTEVGVVYGYERGVKPIFRHDDS